MSRFILTGAVAMAIAVVAACGGEQAPAPLDAPTGAQAPPAAVPLSEEKMSLDRQVLAAKADLARRLGVSADDIELVEAREVTWSDSSLGCPEPDGMYAQVLTPGSLVVLRGAGTEALYHAARHQVPFFCPKDRARRPVEGEGTTQR